MFNFTLFKHISKANAKLFISITVVLCALIAVIMTVFVPSTINDIAEANKSAGINPLGDISSLLAFVGNQYFGMFALILGIIYASVLGNKLIAFQVDRGSMAYHLSAPISRTAITGTSVWFIIISLAVMYTAVFAVGSVVAEIVQPGELDLLSFFTLTFGFFLLQTAIGGIAFAASCVSNRSSYSLAVGAGVPVLFFVLDLLSGMSSKLEPFKHLTLITLYDSGAIINGDSYGGGLTVLAVIAIGLFAYGLWVFRRRDLPL